MFKWIRKSIRYLIPTGNSRGDNVKKAIITNLFVNVVSLLKVVLSARLLIGYLGNDGYGVFMTIISTTNWISLSNFGFGLGLQNLLTDAVAKKDTIRQKQLLSTTQLSLAVICSTVLAIWVALFVLTNISWTQAINASNTRFADDVSQSIFWAGVFIIANMYTSYIQAIYAANQQLHQYNFWTIGSQLVTIVSLFLVITFRSSLIRAVLFYCGSLAIVRLINAIFLIFKHPDRYMPHVRDFSLNEFRTILKYGGSFTLISICGALQYSTDKLIISRTVEPAEVTPYSIVVNLYNMCLALSGVISMPMWAAFANAKAHDDWAWINKRARQLRLFMTGAFMLLVIFMIFAGKPLIRLWVGPSVNTSLTLIALLGIYYLIKTWTDVHSIICNALDKAPATAIFSIPAGVFIVVVMYFFASLWGVNGLALGMGLAFLLTGGWFVPYIAYREIRRHNA